MIKKYFFILIITLISLACKEEEVPQLKTRLTVDETANSEQKIPKPNRATIENPFEIPKPEIEQKSKSRVSQNLFAVTIKYFIGRTRENRSLWDFDGKPDIYGLIAFSSGDAIAVPLQKNSFVASGFSNKIHIAKGDSIYVFMREYDVDGFEEIVKSSFVFEGKTYFSKNFPTSRIAFTIKKMR